MLIRSSRDLVLIQIVNHRTFAPQQYQAWQRNNNRQYKNVGQPKCCTKGGVSGPDKYVRTTADKDDNKANCVAENC